MDSSVPKPINMLNISQSYYMVVTRVDPEYSGRLGTSIPRTRAQMWVFPLPKDLLDLNKCKTVSQEEKNEMFERIYMFRDIDDDEDHGESSSSAGSISNDTIIWWNIVKMQTFTKAVKANNVFGMIFKTNGFDLEGPKYQINETGYYVCIRKTPKLIWGKYHLHYLTASYKEPYPLRIGEIPSYWCTDYHRTPTRKLPIEKFPSYFVPIILPS